MLDLFFNSASTWRGSKVGVAVSVDPMKHWVVYAKPTLQSGNGLLGPGLGAPPMVGLMATPMSSSTSSCVRPTTPRVAIWRWDGCICFDQALVPVGAPSTAGSSDTVGAVNTTRRVVPVPKVGSGVVQRALTVGG